MNKRFITIILSFILCFSAVFAFSGCQFFQKEFTVTFVAGEGKESAEIQGEAVQTVKSPRELVLPVFIFDGWWHDGWSEVIEDIRSDTTVTALWVKKQFQVTFEPGAPDAHLEGKTPLDNNQVTVSVGSGVELMEKAPLYLRDGYTVSWEHIDFGDITDKATLTAKWIPNEYTLKFCDENGVETALPDKKVTFGQSVGNLPTLDDKGEKLFAGWQFTNEQGHNELVSEDSVWLYPKGGDLLAKWRVQGEYTITYLNAYTHSNRLSYKTDEGYTLSNPTRVGYDFMGWSGTDIDGVNLDVTIEIGETGDKTYTANWRACKYDLTFNADGGTVDQSVMQVTFMEKIGSMPVAEKEGYEFDGWITSNGTVITADTVWMQTGSITVTAQYKRVLTIKFVLDCTVRNEQVSCIMPSVYISEYNLTKVDGENAYIMKGYKEGDSLPDLPRPTTSDPEEYAFSSWKYNTVKKIPGTVLNDDNFPGAMDSGEIVLIVACYALWTPFY